MGRRCHAVTAAETCPGVLERRGACCRSVLEQAGECAVKVRHHTLGYAPVSGLFAWCNFGVIPSPNYANSRPWCTLAKSGVPALSGRQ
jgi:hypothetical protein